MTEQSNVILLDLFRVQKQFACADCGTTQLEVYAIGHRCWIWCPKCDVGLREIWFKEPE